MRVTVRSGRSTRTERSAERFPASGASSDIHETPTVSTSSQCQPERKYVVGDSQYRPIATILASASIEKATVKNHSAVNTHSGSSRLSGSCG